ncbi:MAG: hypothetical protein COV74_03330 [Candidatus Omnitrophica bacterium CG11_big_fil_rev_8_21_14_0_20_45_26]|uniref:Bacterial type II secretion system protein E domain-containing protein n=1 Tax=Candidatus Abzuiibacterium crystallinum TaxID=1974748 RepID=A0A2H0LR85_9BACT|nr:MAG: hypothetical protein COV74_03330 [Candidatus Omnitrophica bacterium CG11_big_fil_rev_8_21_14_0_20_45_26]PIW64707.1 MAG: hypothetical protein COW12_05355 [Candidatus Omnitrophica bacterium CG12_big_fil_rev_8_21_14_0_65_45_16]
MNVRIEKACFDKLIKANLLPQAELEKLYEESMRAKNSFSEQLIQLGLIKESVILKIYSEVLNIPYIEKKRIAVDDGTLKKVPIKFAWYYKFFPISLEGRKLTIAVSRLIDVNTLDEIRLGLGFDISLAFIPSQDIQELLKKHYGLGAETVDKILSQRAIGKEYVNPSADVSSEEVEDLEKLAESASVVQLVNQIILEAVKKRASDIHIEPSRGKVRFRYRIDGVLHEAPVPQDIIRFLPTILSRIKIMANLNIVEKRLPQDGKARVRTQNQSIDLRISSIPTSQGESMVIRILPNQMVYDLANLGLEEAYLKKFKQLLQRNEGIVFLTGPTGSGKSTTLYAGIQQISKTERKIITIEDPVEYEMGDITQIQVVPDVGLTFAKGLRSMLRHDPDVMMVGEVRDLETADIAIRAALTGHLILSTLHTNDAASGVTRLLDIGVEPYLIASSVIAFMAQRLVRVICPACKTEVEQLPDEIHEMIERDLAMTDENPIKAFYGRGCDQCFETGYQGRIAIHEMLEIDQDIKQLIYQKATAEQIKAFAMTKGMKTLRQDGWQKVLAGQTTADEVLRATSAVPDIIPMPFKMTSAQKVKIETPDQGFHNKRKYERLMINFPITYRIVDDQGQKTDSKEKLSHPYGRGVTENISAGGISFLTRDPIKAGSILELKLEMPDQLDPIQCLGRTLRVMKVLDWVGDAGGYRYKLAVLFLAINSVDRTRIENFCELTIG